jgi:hypothetical protein
MFRLMNLKIKAKGTHLIVLNSIFGSEANMFILKNGGAGGPACASRGGGDPSTG